MAARRAFGIRRELMNRIVLRPAYYPPAGALRRASTNQAKGGNGMGGILLRTLALAGAGGACAVVALEKVPGVQDSIERVVPGFKDKYSQSRLATMDWYRMNSERVAQSIDSLTTKVKGVRRSNPPEPPPPVPKVPTRQESARPSATATKGSGRVETQATKVPEATPSTQAQEQQAPASGVGRQGVTQKSTDGSKKKDEVKPARKKDPVSQEHTPSKVKTPEPVKDARAEPTEAATVEQHKTKIPENPKSVSETTRDTKVSPKSQPLSEPVKDAGAEQKDATLEHRREAKDALSSALKGFTTAAEMAVMSHEQTFAQNLSSALSSMDDVGVSGVAKVADKEQSALSEKKHTDALKEYKMQKSELEKAIHLAKESNLGKKASRAEAKLKEWDFKISVLEHTTDLAQKSLKEQRVLQPESSLTDTPLSSVSQQCDELTRLQGMLKASREEVEALREKGKEQAAQLEAEVSRLAQEKVVGEMEKETLAHKVELEKQARDFELQYEEKLREQLRRQIIAQEEQMAKDLLVQSQQLNDRWLQESERQLKDQGTQHQMELARTKAHLQAVDCMIDSISDAGKEVSKQQTLRAACETLYKALTAVDKRTDVDELHKFEREVAALKDAAKDNTFVTTVLTGIPKEAITGEGIHSAPVLAERFKKVKRVCRHVALVPEEGGGIGAHIASAVASALSFNRVPRHMIDARTPIVEMDTYGLVEQADAYLHHGDLEMAVRCMNQLHGEPRCMASDWISDARVYLETKQAVTVIRDHVAASSVSIL